MCARQRLRCRAPGPRSPQRRPRLFYYYLVQAPGKGGGDGGEREGRGDGSWRAPRPATPTSAPRQAVAEEETVVRAAFDAAAAPPRLQSSVHPDLRRPSGCRFPTFAVNTPVLYEDYREVLLRHSLTRRRPLTLRSTSAFRCCQSFETSVNSLGADPAICLASSTAVFRERKTGRHFWTGCLGISVFESGSCPRSLKVDFRHRTALNASSALAHDL